MEQFICYTPTRLTFGVGCHQKVAEEAKKLGQRALLVIDPFFLKHPSGQGIHALLQECLQDVEIFSKIEPNPLHTSIDEAVTLCRDHACDVLVALGGGSAIDTAKAVSVVAPYGGLCWDYTERSGADVARPQGPGIPVIAIPTTAGTGAETTRFAVINNPKAKSKCTIFSDYMIPALALIDPLLMSSMPKDLTVYTGFDAFAHALEALLSRQSTPFSNMFAKESIRCFHKGFQKSIEHPDDLSARADMAFASTMAGIAISHAGTTLPHGMGQTLSGITNAPHGASVAACLPQVIAWTLPFAQDIFAAAARILHTGLAKASDEEAASALPGIIESLLLSVGCSAHFRTLGLKEEYLNEFVDQMVNTRQGAIRNHPKEASRDELLQLVIQCL